MLVTLTVQGRVNAGPGYFARLQALQTALQQTAELHLASVLVGVDDETPEDDEGSDEQQYKLLSFTST
jgi:hypothetical protein